MPKREEETLCVFYRIEKMFQKSLTRTEFRFILGKEILF
jgi:hypothetical protein